MVRATFIIVTGSLPLSNAVHGAMEANFSSASVNSYHSIGTVILVVLDEAW